MKTIEQDIIKAVRNRKNLLTGSASGSGYAQALHLTGYRDSLEWDRDKKCFRYKLWGHLIFRKTGLHTVTVSDCGYRTNTTASRLNALFAALDIPMTVMFRNGYTYWCKDGEIYTMSSFSFIHAGEYDVTIVC
jgi:hypothetical protein